MIWILLRAGAVAVLAGSAVAWHLHCKRKKALALPPLRPMPPGHPDWRAEHTTDQEWDALDGIAEASHLGVGLAILDGDEGGQQ